MQVDEWGSHLWIPLHCMTFNTPIILSNTDKKEYISFFTKLGNFLPCSFCRNSYIYFCKKLKPKYFFNDQHGITYWLYCIHNLVNIKLGKKQIPYKDVVIMYEKKRASYKNSLCYKNDKLDYNLVDIYVKKSLDKYHDMADKIMNKIINKGKKSDWKF